MDYLHETEELLKEIFCVDWIGDNKIDDIIDETLKASGTTLEDLASIIETAAKNGHSIKEQKEILNEILT